MKDKIVVRGARQHNLANIDVAIPKNALVVITGVSGSGKSSLAFDTLFAEGQRRYVESLSAYARQFLEKMDKPDVDSIEGLCPAVSVDQRSASRNPRSTVGTVTEIHDYFRLLWASIGIPHCPECGSEIRARTVEEMVEEILSMPEGTRFMLLAPVVRDRKGELKNLFKDLLAKGYVRARVDGEPCLLEDPPELDRNKRHDVDVVVDRLVAEPRVRSRLAASLETALELADGLVVVATTDGNEMLLSSRHACPSCGVSLPEINPRLFSFNAPQGACPACDGLGHTLTVDPEALVPFPHRSVIAGCFAIYPPPLGRSWISRVRSYLRSEGIDPSTPWEKLPEEVKETILWRRRRGWRDFEGIARYLVRRYKETESEEMREQIEKYMAVRTCAACKGARLRPEALAVKVRERNIAEVSSYTVSNASSWFRSIKLTHREEQIAGRVLKEITDRLGFLEEVGLGYLTLDRRASTLSGGESQRIRLATQIGSKLTGVLYVLDEPSVGLHQRDQHRLLSILRQMKEMGNTVVVVEHDRDTIETADWIVDLGPGAGAEGGHVVAEGPPASVAACDRSLTGQYLSGKAQIPVPSERRKPQGKVLRVLGASEHNLKNIDVEFPLGCFVCVTGVSGSGKSTLVDEILYRALARALHSASAKPGAHKAIEGLEHVDRVVMVDQAPIGRTPRSNPATYVKVFDPIRQLFAATTEARARGYKPGRFSFNVPGGRCEACEGAGTVRIQMHFLPDVFVTCEVCKGTRYNRETLEVKYKGLNIAQVLELTVDEAYSFFKAIPRIARLLDTMRAVGLGYIKLGQPATTLSGGEAQRIKLARELAKRSTGKTVYILDEPTTGLHFHDIAKLLAVLQALVDRGNTVIVIEHNMDVIKCADWIVDLGPEGGDEGGRVVACGTPEAVAKYPSSHTGRYLRQVLKM